MTELTDHHGGTGSRRSNQRGDRCERRGRVAAGPYGPAGGSREPAAWVWL